MAIARATAIQSIAPFFIVGELARALRFYVERLDFEVRYLAPADDPFFAIVGRDSVQIMLKEITPEVQPQPNGTRHENAPWDAFVYVPDPEALAAEFSARGLPVQVSVRDDELRGFEVRDSEGYVLYFGRPDA